jgi:acetyltransferase-like isoleucine patch superfamily enzyme
MKRLGKWIVEVSAPIVQRVAHAYGVPVRRAFEPLGEWPIVIEDPPEIARRYIPASVMFNTRSGRIAIGSGTVCGEEVMLLTGKHMDAAEAAEHGVPLHTVPESGRDISIGRHCYIGSRAIIVGPVSIGEYSVVGAGAVVTRDVPAYTFVAGNPARAIKDVRATAPERGSLTK